MQDVVYVCGKVISVDSIHAKQHRLLRHLVHLVRLELLDAQLLATLGRGLERLEQEAAHDGVQDDDGSEADVGEQGRSDRLHAFVAPSTSTFQRSNIVVDVVTTLHVADYRLR